MTGEFARGLRGCWSFRWCSIVFGRSSLMGPLFLGGSSPVSESELIETLSASTLRPMFAFASTLATLDARLRLSLTSSAAAGLFRWLVTSHLPLLLVAFFVEHPARLLLTLGAFTTILRSVDSRLVLEDLTG